MEQKLKDEWAKALDSLMELPSDKRRHFALLLVNLAKCYIDDSGWKAVILVAPTTPCSPSALGLMSTKQPTCCRWPAIP